MHSTGTLCDMQPRAVFVAEICHSLMVELKGYHYYY